MEYTKENIFPLYVGKCKVKTPEGEFKLIEFSLPENFIDSPDYKISVAQNGMINVHNISDCQLALKPISGMSEEERLEYKSHCFNNLYETSKSFLYLISKGIAISDELFDLNIAVLSEAGK